jgi:hypothetical protein
MATDTTPVPHTGALHPEKVVMTDARRPDITLYSHSPIIYWWPVWLLALVLALATYLDGHRLAVVPAGTAAEGNVLKGPAGSTLEPPFDRVHASPYLGTAFFVVAIVVIGSSIVQLRGLWGWISLLTLLLAVTVMSLFHWWDTLGRWLGLMHIYISLSGYLFVGLALLAVWLLAMFLFDRRTYVTFSSGQVRIRDQIGQAEKVFDVTNMTVQVMPNVFLRHRLLGFWGAGDLIITTGGPHSETLEWPNVLFARSRLRQIQERLKSREVV